MVSKLNQQLWFNDYIIIDIISPGGQLVKTFLMDDTLLQYIQGLEAGKQQPCYWLYGV